MSTKLTLWLPILLALILSSHLLQAQQQRKYRVLYSEMIFFESGKHQIPRDQYDKLYQAIQRLTATPESQVMVLAHTDSVGSYESNKLLAENRAAAVQTFLLSQGLDSSRLDMRAFGSLSPLSDNSTEQGRAMNRRVSFYVHVPYDEDAEGAWTEIEGRLLSKGRPLPGRLVFSYLGGVDTLDVDSSGYYLFRLEQLTNIEIRAYAKGHFFIAKVFSPKNRQRSRLDFNLEPALLGEKMMLNNLYFKGGSPMLLPSSERALLGIADFLKYNEDLRVEIGGHINKPFVPPVEEDSPSFKLSENRAKAVYEALLELGVAQGQLTYKGYGNAEMLHPQAETEIEQQLNRRVELKIIR